jgi:hypothetical protein
MNDERMREDEERRVLLGARRALSPTDADAQRVLASTLSALSAASAAPAAGSSAPAAEPLAPTAQSSVAEAAAGWGALPKLLAALALAGASGMLGYGLGFRAGQTSSAPSLETAKTAAPAERIAAVARSNSDSASDSVPDSVSDSDSVSDPDSVTATGVGLARRSRPAPARLAAEQELSPIEPDPNALALELRALRQVERALRERQPRRALELLGELDRDVPEGRLVEERLATFLMARCALGLGTPARLRAEFNDAYPRSVYRARVEQSCADAARRE